MSRGHAVHERQTFIDHGSHFYTFYMENENELTPDSTDISVSYLPDLAAPLCIILVGKFYLPDIDWDTLSVASHSSELFCNFVFNNNLTQLIAKPTHVKGNILDLIVTNTSHRIQQVNIS